MLFSKANHPHTLAYTKLAVLKLPHGIGHFRLKAQRYLMDLKAMHQELARFTG